MYNIIQLNDKDLSELQSIAKELGITKTESLKKEELVYKILDEQAIVGATKKVAAAKVNEDRKENQPKKRSRISVKKEGDKVYTATKDKAQKLEAATPTTAAHIAEEAEKEAVSTVETAQPIQEKTVTEAVEKSEPKKRGRKPGTKNKTAAKTEGQPATTAEETNNTTPQKVSATNTPKEKEVILCKEHRDLAREAARKSFVLLKNEEKILPLGKEKKIAWVGPYVHSRNLMGSWSFIGDAKDVTNLEEAVKAQADTTNMSFHAGSPMLGSDIRLEGFGEAMEQSHTPEEEETMLLEAVNAAKEADVVVLAIGEDRLQSGEATSNANIRIPEIQQRLLERVSKVNENVVVVLFNGRPLDLRDVVSKAKAVLEVWMPGTEGANAIADVVFGAYAPSGKLTMSFPYSVGQVPVHYNEYSTGRPHVPGKDKDRFRSKYLDIAIGHTGDKQKGTPDATQTEIEHENIDNVDFCLELLHSDVINVAYILALIADLNPDSEDYRQKRQQIIDTMIRDASMRNKAKLIDGFIQQNVDDDKAGFNRAKADGSIDLETRLTNYVSAARERAIERLADEEALSHDALREFLAQYDYLQREKPEIIQNAIKEKKVGLKERRNILKRVLAKLRIIIDTFNWE